MTAVGRTAPKHHGARSGGTVCPTAVVGVQSLTSQQFQAPEPRVMPVRMGIEEYIKAGFWFALGMALFGAIAGAASAALWFLAGSLLGLG